MNVQTDGTGCPFFRWEEAYFKLLEKESRKEKEKQADGVTKSLLEKQLNMESIDCKVVQVELRTLISIGHEIVGLLKCILCMRLVIVVVHLLLVFVHLKK
jgi:hypothetical protein